MVKERAAMARMMALATMPPAESTLMLKAIQKALARAARMKPSRWCFPRRHMERNMKMAAAQSRA